MAKKSLIAGLAIIILSLCCGVCFATDSNDNLGATNLGNEITQSLNKTGETVQNIVRTTTGTNELHYSENNMGSTNTIRNTAHTNTNHTNTANYNATRTAATTTFGGMTTTTWMWIILAVVAVIIIAAIWYYATQNSSRD